MTASLKQLQAATTCAWRHLLDVHGINAGGSASHIEAAHQAAHRREGTPWHPAWNLDDLASEPKEEGR